MTMQKHGSLRLLSATAILTATAIALGACASRTEAELYDRIAFPETRAKPAAQHAPQPAPAYDRLGAGSGAGGGGGGGGGGH